MKEKSEFTGDFVAIITIGRNPGWEREDPGNEVESAAKLRSVIDRLLRVKMELEYLWSAFSLTVLY